VLAYVFRDKDRILLVDYLVKGTTIITKYYVALLDKLKQHLIYKRRGKLSKALLFLLENAAPYKAASTRHTYPL
jgi:hypothetical protein